jgi:tripartite-type tricarboxylate transporter receptor subunit TctC
MVRNALTAALALTAVCTANATLAQDAWPSRPIRMVVPFPPGGGTDTFARPLAAKLGEQLGQQVVIDNRGGAGGTLGAALVAKANPDGYTWLMGAVHHTVAVTAYKSLPYDLDRDLKPVTGVAYMPDVLVINLQIPAKNVQELVAYAKANPAKVNYGSSGQGTTRHLSGELFNTATGTKLVHVPYKGSGPAMTGLIGGEVTLIFEGLGSAATHIRSGKVRALAVTSAKRSPAFPDVPTMAEAGVPRFEVTSWYGLWVPAGTPDALVKRIRDEVSKALASPQLAAYWAQQGADPGGEPTDQYAKFVKAETQRWGKVVRDSGVTAE